MESVPYIIDGIIILIPLVSMIVGFKKGFASIVLPLATTIGCLVLCKMYAGTIANEISTMFIHGQLTKFVSTEITNGIESGATTLSDSLPEWLLAMAQAAGFSANKATSSLPIDEISEKTATNAESIIIIPVIICLIYVIAYIVSRLIGRILVKPTNLIAKLPLIKQSNKFLGGVLGLVSGAVRLGIILLIAVTVISLADNKEINALISQTHILQLAADKIQNIF